MEGLISIASVYGRALVRTTTITLLQVGADNMRGRVLSLNRLVMMGISAISRLVPGSPSWARGQVLMNMALIATCGILDR
jgi:hypothetical protein